MHQPNISHDIFWNLVFTLDLSSLLTDAPSAPSPITLCLNSVPEKQKERKDSKSSTSKKVTPKYAGNNVVYLLIFFVVCNKSFHIIIINLLRQVF